MHEHLGEEFSGVVTSVTNFGVFVTLDAMYVEGLIHITELGGEYYRFDEARQELRGERSGMRYAIGSRVQVQVSRVDLDARRIDFRLLQDDEGLSRRGSKEGSPTGNEKNQPERSSRDSQPPSARTSRKVSEPLPSNPPAGKRRPGKKAAKSEGVKSNDKGRSSRRRT